MTLCDNICKSRMQVEDALTHELIHAYDDVNDQLTGTTNMNACEAWMCSEIRAANLSGDCKFSREILRGNIKSLAAHQQVKFLYF